MKFDEFCEFLENFGIITRVDENGDLYFIDMENEVAMAASYENHSSNLRINSIDEILAPGKTIYIQPIGENVISSKKISYYIKDSVGDKILPHFSEFCYVNQFEQNEIKFEELVHSNNIRIKTFKCLSNNNKTKNKVIRISSLGVIFYFDEDEVIHTFGAGKFLDVEYDEKMAEELLFNRIITIFSEYYGKISPGFSSTVKEAKSYSRLNAIKEIKKV